MIWGSLRGARGEQVAQIDHRVRLDVHHVVHGTSLAVGERVVGISVPVEIAQVELLRGAQVAVEVELDQFLCAHHNDSTFGDPIGSSPTAVLQAAPRA